MAEQTSEKKPVAAGEKKEAKKKSDELVSLDGADKVANALAKEDYTAAAKAVLGSINKDKAKQIGRQYAGKFKEQVTGIQIPLDQVVLEAWCQKKGDYGVDVRKWKWRRRYLRLGVYKGTHVISYYKKHMEGHKARGYLDLSEVTRVWIPDSEEIKQEHGLEDDESWHIVHLLRKPHSGRFRQNKPARRYALAFETESVKNEWMTTLESLFGEAAVVKPNKVEPKPSEIFSDDEADDEEEEKERSKQDTKQPPATQSQRSWESTGSDDDNPFEPMPSAGTIVTNQELQDASKAASPAPAPADTTPSDPKAAAEAKPTTAVEASSETSAN